MLLAESAGDERRAPARLLPAPEGHERRQPHRPVDQSGARGLSRTNSFFTSGPTVLAVSLVP
ncbi:hypothetical protein ACIQ1J_06890 [Streptomyces sp. NPDC097107]|uniref:hypothetical protein n=1 Tax=Streptomyces sp. NPDC097107 TaxID=3366089 RepID=UPI00380428DA